MDSFLEAHIFPGANLSKISCLQKFHYREKHSVHVRELSEVSIMHESLRRKPEKLLISLKQGSREIIAFFSSIQIGTNDGTEELIYTITLVFRCRPEICKFYVEILVVSSDVCSPVFVCAVLY